MIGASELPARQESAGRSVGLEEFDLQRCAEFLAPLGQAPQMAARVASEVHRRSRPRQNRLLRRSTGRAAGRRCAIEGIAAVLFEVKEGGILHSSSDRPYKRGAARQTRRRRAGPGG